MGSYALSLNVRLLLKMFWNFKVVRYIYIPHVSSGSEKDPTSKLKTLFFQLKID